MGKAIYVDCPGMSNPREHTMRDHCWSCAPYWERIPTCPKHNTKLLQRQHQPVRWTPEVKGYCRECKKHYQLEI
mgnify:FL=1